MKHSLILFLLMLLLGCAKAPPTPTNPSKPAAERPTPEAVVERAIKAFGGPEKLARWNVGKVTYKESAAFVGPFEREATLEDTFQLPGHVKRIARSKAGERVFVVNNGSGWEKKADGSISPIKNNPSTDRTSHLFTNFIDIRSLQDDDVKLSVVGDERVSGQDTIVLRATYEPDVHVDFFFDKATGLPVKTIQPNPFKPGTTSETFLTEYRDFDGGMVPTRIRTHQGDKLLVDITIIDLEFVEKWDESVFGKP